MTRRDASAQVVEALRASPPELDELRRARMERRLLDTVARREAGEREAGEREAGEREAGDREAAPRERRASERRGGRVLWAASGALAVAAAFGLAWLVVPRDHGPVARFEMGGASGTLDVGGTLEVGRGERAEVRVGGVELALAGDSAMRFASLDARDVRMQLTSGRIDVAFHPRERGRERLSIETPSARVEVVGTVFTVQLEGDATRVSVSEGTVRVVPRAAAESAVLVHAGESVRIDGEPRASAEVVEADAPEALEAVAVAPSAPELSPAASPATAPGAADPAPLAAPEPVAVAGPAPVPSAGDVVDALPDTSVAPPSVQPVSARQRLSAARRLLESGAHRRARALLAELTRMPDAALDVRVEAWSLLADSLVATGEPREAADAYERAASLGRGRPEGHVAIYALARVQERGLGDRGAARETYLRYLREAPSGANAELARRAVCRLGGDPEIECPEGGAR